MKLRILSFVLFLSCIVQAQTLEECYQKNDKDCVLKFEKDTATLTGKQLAYLGHMFFSKGDDLKAILILDKAITRGYTESFAYFFKGLALRYQGRIQEAKVELSKAIEINPNNQNYETELALCYLASADTVRALELYEKAQITGGDNWTSFFVVGHLYNVMGQKDKALFEFYDKLPKVPKDNEYYPLMLEYIGDLEFRHKKDYKKAIQAFSQLVDLDPKDYAKYPLLMKSYNSAGKHKDANKLYLKMKDAFEKSELPKEFMDVKSTQVDEFYWEGKKVMVFKYFIKPKNVIDLSYKMYLLNTDATEVERTFMVEKTLDFGKKKSFKHLLCEKGKDGSHMTYSIGWREDEIEVKSVKEVLLKTLNEDAKPGASSSFKPK